MINVLSDFECKSIISKYKNTRWEKINFGYSYYETPINEFSYTDKILKTFQIVKNITISKQIIRLLKFEIGDHLIPHTFNYTTLSNNLYKDTKFGMIIFLNTDYSGGSFYLNNQYNKVLNGSGIIYDIHDVGKITKIKKGTLYLLISHILDINTNKLI